MKLAVTLLLGALLVLPFAGFVSSQETEIAKYPTRPITFVVPFPPGGGTDLACRLLCKEAEKFLGQPVVVLNKPGAGGTMGVAAVAAAKPDGYTIGMSHGQALFILPFLEKLPYQPLKDLRYIMQFVELNFGVLVKADSPLKTFGDLVAYARRNHTKTTYGTNSPNSLSSIIVEQIAKREKMHFTHIPFKGSPEYQVALLGGHVLFTAGEFNFSMVDAGQTRILLFLGEKRSPEYPQVPTLKDLGYDIPTPLFICVAGPKGLSPEIVKKLEEAFTKALAEPAFIKGMKELCLTISYRNNKDISDYIAHNYEIFPKILKNMGLVK